MTESLKFMVAIGMLCLPLSFTFAQTTGTGSLESENIIIEKQFEAIIKDAVKIELSPGVDASADEKKDMRYSVPARPIDLPYNPISVRPIAIPRETPQALQNLYIKAGLGTKLLALVDAAYHDRNVKNLEFGAYYKHLSAHARKRENQIFSDNVAGAYVGYFFKKVKIGSEFEFTRNVDHFYGYNESDTTYEKKDVRQRIRNFDGKLYLASSKKNNARISFLQDFSFYFLDEISGINEGGIASFTGISKEILKEHKAGLDLKFNIWNLERTITRTRYVIDIKPNYQFSNDNWKFNVASSVLLEDSILHIFPDLRAQKKLIHDKLIVFGGWKKELQQNTFKSVVATNPYINTDVTLRNSRASDLYIGMTGAHQSFSYNATLSNKKVTRLPLFINDPSDSKRFDLFYEPQSKIVILHAELGYQYLKNLKSVIAADYFNYNNDVAEKAWHLPKFELTLTTSYDWKSKVFFTADVFHRSGAYAMVPDEDPVKLKSAVDINLGAQYKFSNNLSFFLDLNNLASIKHEQWLNYPTYGFTGLIGAKLSY